MNCNFLVSWKDSLALLVVPRQISLFSLVTLKTFLATCKRLLLLFWWLIALCIGFDKVLIPYYHASSAWDSLGLLIGGILLWLLWFFIVYLTVRPSTKLKIYHYYRQYWYFYPIMVGFILVTYIVIARSCFFLEDQLLRSTIELSKASDLYKWGTNIVLPLITGFMPSSLIPFFLSPFASFYMFFLLDSNGGIVSIFSSVWRAIKMIFLNYPFCLVTVMAFLIGYNRIHALELTTGFPFVSIATFVGVPFIQSVYANFYTKRLHDQFQCYFPQTVKE